MVSFTAHSTQRAFEHIANQIEQQILEGNLMRGDKLPGERELAEQFQVSRIVIREALRTLSARGFVEVRHGVGSFIKRDFPKLLSRGLNLFLATEKSSLLHLLELRKVLEIHASILACRNATEQDLSIMQREIERMKQKADSGNGWQEGEDFEFHLAIAHASKNPFLATILNAILDLHKEGRYTALGPIGDANHYFVQHQAMYEAIKLKDEQRASGIMQHHFEEAAEDIVEAKQRDE